jgi:hypothetical protein
MEKWKRRVIGPEWYRVLVPLVGLLDAPDLGSSAARRRLSSSPTARLELAQFKSCAARNYNNAPLHQPPIHWGRWFDFSTAYPTLR